MRPRCGIELFDPATAIVVDFGDGNPQISSDPTRSVAIAFDKTGQTWAYLTIYDPK